MKRVHSLERYNGAWESLNWRKVAPSFWTRLANFQQRRRSLCYEFSRSTNLSVSAGIRQFVRTSGYLRPQIPPCRLPLLRASFELICFIGLMFFLFKFLLCEIEKMTYPCWWSTSSTDLRGNRERR